MKKFCTFLLVIFFISSPNYAYACNCAAKNNIEHNNANKVVREQTINASNFLCQMPQKNFIATSKTNHLLAKKNVHHSCCGSCVNNSERK